MTQHQGCSAADTRRLQPSAAQPPQYPNVLLDFETLNSKSIAMKI